MAFFVMKKYVDNGIMIRYNIIKRYHITILKGGREIYAEKSNGNPY